MHSPHHRWIPWPQYMERTFKDMDGGKGVRERASSYNILVLNPVNPALRNHDFSLSNPGFKDKILVLVTKLLTTG